RHRFVTAVDHEVVQALHQWWCDRRIDRGRTLVHRPDQPPRAVHADEPDVGEPFGGANPGPELLAVVAVNLLGRHTVVEKLFADLRAYLVPDALTARRGEHAQLQRAVAVDQDHLLDPAVVVGLHAHLDAIDGGHAQRAEVQ